MAVNHPATSAHHFPVVLFDGRREMPAGNIKIHSDLLFKQFQFNLSHLLGISYNNLTTYFIDNHNRRKILITGKVNFAVLLREMTNGYFLVVLKRSRRDRRKKPPENSSPAAVYDYMNMIYSSSLNANFPAIGDVYGRNGNESRLRCEECLVAVKENKVPEFHCCVYDEVVFGGFRSPYGPIGRKR
ncbi:hypothetical protein CTI12_AA170390 [Artemisia annua]|uniref:DUF7138 domain-containing protein n=1 Tax=Artemisia annua TaxID=35608 RepID=A0A2U1PC03_ARTAN|nr:hypothetical protein CTI12_AA170390 [Artemisia annua]